jgi:transcriptional regulator with XRE-family HTH domain
VGRAAKTLHSKAYASFLQRLIRARHDAGLTQVEVAELLGRPQSFVSKSEAGERRVDVIELVEFARVYRKRIDFFLPQPTARATP